MIDGRTFPVGAQISVAQLSENPYPLFQRLLAEEPITWLPQYKMWLVARRADVVAILRDAETFTMVPPAGQINPMEALFGPMMLSLDGPPHKQVRDLFMEPFRPKHVRLFYAELIQEICYQLLDEMVGQERVDLTAVFSDKLAILTVVSTLGLDVNDTSTFRDWYDAFGAAIANIERDPDIATAGEQAFEAFTRLIAVQIEQLKQTPNSSVLSEIIHHPANDLTIEQIVSNCALTFFGGVETTTSMISNALWCLLAHPEAFTAVQNDPTLLPNALEESMRWETAVQSAMRFPTRDVILHGIEIKQGEKIYCLLGGANRDPAVFDEPDRFDIYRANADKHLSFAYGPHFCFGAPLARLEATVGIGQLLARFPNLRLDPTMPTKPVGHEFRSPPHLHVYL